MATELVMRWAAGVSGRAASCPVVVPASRMTLPALPGRWVRALRAIAIFCGTFRVSVSTRPVRVRTCRWRGAARPVDPLDQAALIQHFEVAANRLGRHAEAIGQLGDRDPVLLVGQRDNCRWRSSAYIPTSSCLYPLFYMVLCGNASLDKRRVVLIMWLSTREPRRPKMTTAELLRGTG